MHPVENKRVGLYHNPIAILDFASLYPSLYRHDAPNYQAGHANLVDNASQCLRNAGQ